MALSGPVLLIADPDTTNATNYVSPSASPTAGALIVANVLNTDGTDAILPSSFTSGFSIQGSWTQAITIQHSAGTRRLTRYWAIAHATAPGSGTVTADFGADAQTGCTIIVREYTGQHATTPVRQSTSGEVAGAGATSISITLPGALAAASSIMDAALGHNTNEDQTAGGGSTELASSDVGYATPAFRLGIYTEVNDTTVSASWATTSVAIAVASEIVEAAGGLADAQAEIAFMELEIPTANAQAEISHMEFEVPTASAQAEISFMEFEVPTAAAEANLAWMEFEVPLTNAQAEISFMEFEVPEFGAPPPSDSGRRNRTKRFAPKGGGGQLDVRRRSGR